MRSKSQRKKEHMKRRRQKKELRQRRHLEDVQRAVGSPAAARQYQRFLQQVPQGWAGESPEDVAVFDDQVLQSLPPEQAQQVTAVRAALQDAVESRGSDALQRVASIPRSSPVSPWRLFIRGLIAWLANDPGAAGESWRRLDPERRPGRIAIAMMAALRTDLDQAAETAVPAQPAAEVVAPWSSPLGRTLLYHAKLLRRMRFDRVALRTAKAGLSVPEESKDLVLGPNKIRWLARFIAEHEAMEPDLTAALARVALHRAYRQRHSDLFEEAILAFPGPRHDPKNLLLSYGYFSGFRNNDRASQLLDTYLKQDLPNNTNLTEPVRAAIASQIHLLEAMDLVDRSQPTFPWERADTSDDKAIRQHFRAAAAAYPAHRAVYREYLAWIESTLDRLRGNRGKPDAWEKERAQVMRDWAKGLPDDAEPRLWLVDYLLDEELTEEAKPHVEWLSAARHDDPRVRATPWKWQLLEASRLSRRKAWLGQIPERLAEAERLWPEWLSRPWLAYWKAASHLRQGDTAAYEQQRAQIAERGEPRRDSLADACMMLGAAQWLNVPSATLKQLRGPVDRAVKTLGQLSRDDLVEVSAFFWDLHRVRLEYPAMRMHGSKFGKRLLAQFKANPKYVREQADDARVQSAVLWAAEHRFWMTNYDPKPPPWLTLSLTKQHAVFAAAKVRAWLQEGYRYGGIDDPSVGARLRDAALGQRDAFYRYWFQYLAQGLEDNLARSKATRFNFGPGFFGAGPMGGAGGMGPADEDDEGYDDGVEDLDFDDEEGDKLDLLDDLFRFDPDCDCPECQAAKRAFQAAQRFPGRNADRKDRS